jgi:hypothetical protein
VTEPQEGDAVHYVEHEHACMLSVARGTTHPHAGDDDQWCISLDFHGWGHRDHVPHGYERGHWHHRDECRRIR